MRETQETNPGLQSNVLLAITPNPQDFIGSTYPERDVGRDLNVLSALRAYGRQPSRELFNAKLVEHTIIELAELDEWFGDDLYDDDPDLIKLTTSPTALPDDVLNHIDIVGVIKNAATLHEATPFAMDATCSTNPDIIRKKFHWLHAYGKTDRAPETASEFGTIEYGRPNGEKHNIETVRPLPGYMKYGLKIPGFASAKYYEDKNNPWDPAYPKGRIKIMPKFIVGYPASIAQTLVDGKPTRESVSQQAGEESNRNADEKYIAKLIAYNQNELTARWCTLLECAQQASDIKYMLKQLSEEEVSSMNPGELEIAYKQITAIGQYFQNALNMAEQYAKENQMYQMAKEAAEKSPICQLIMQQSHNTYVEGDWKKPHLKSPPPPRQSEMP